MTRLARAAGLLVLRGIAFLFLLWAFGALWFDAPFRAAAWLFPAAVLVAIAVWRRRATLIAFIAGGFVLGWWWTLQPSHDRVWETAASRLPLAEIDGDTITIRNVRDFDYPAGAEPVPRWVDRTVHLADLAAIDIAINYWGSELMAHPVLIFRFHQAPPLAFSIEIRREEGEKYSALAGLYKNYELIILAGSERDLVGVRTNHREDEDVHLYATTVGPENMRTRFLDYIGAINAIHREARWYNALTANCTTTIRRMGDSGRMPFDWRMIVNGLGDRMLHERGILRSDGLPFEELKARALINPAARAADLGDDFSSRIREDRPGFTAR